MDSRDGRCENGPLESLSLCERGRWEVTLRKDETKNKWHDGLTNHYNPLPRSVLRLVFFLWPAADYKFVLMDCVELKSEQTPVKYLTVYKQKVNGQT